MLKEPEAPRRPDENDTRPVSGRGDDRLLLWCLLASLLINFGFGLWLNYADLYGEKHQADINKVMHFKTYIPPVKKPKPPKPPKPPKIIPPKVQPKLITKVPPRPLPPRPQPVARQVTTTTTKSVNAVPIGPPTPPAPPAPATPSDNTDVPTPHPSPTPQPVQPTPAPTPTPQPPAHHDPPPTPPPPVHRPGYTEVAEQEAAPIGDYPNPPPDMPQDADVTSLHSCTVAWDVNEEGRPTNVHITGHSGNGEVDRAVESAIRGMRFQPAIQDHYKQVQPMTYTYNFSG